MFVYSFRASTIKFFGIIGAALLALVALIVFVPTSEAVPTTAAIAAQRETINYDKMKNTENIVSFLAQFGWEVEATPYEETDITIPAEFDKVMNAYNELQKQQGLDLSKYKKKDVHRYTFVIKNYPDYEGTVYANVIVYKHRVIGGDICSADVAGFIHGFAAPQKGE